MARSHDGNNGPEAGAGAPPAPAGWEAPCGEVDDEEGRPAQPRVKLSPRARKKTLIERKENLSDKWRE